MNVHDDQARSAEIAGEVGQRILAKQAAHAGDWANLPENLPDLLSPAPAFLADQPVVGLWPAGAVEAIEAILTGDGRHSMLQFAEAIGARAVKTGSGSDNINTQADLAALEKRHGL